MNGGISFVFMAIGLLAAVFALVVVWRRSGTGTLKAPAGPADDSVVHSAASAPLPAARTDADPSTAAATAPAAAPGTAALTPAEAAAAAAATAESLAAARREADEIRTRAETDATAIRSKAEEAADQADQGRREAEEQIRAVREEIRELRSDLERRENRLADREQRLDKELHRLEDRSAELDQRQRELNERAADIDQLDAQRTATLERVAGLTAIQAKSELVGTIENQAKREAVLMVRDIEHRGPGRGRRSGPARSSRWPSSGWPASRPASRWSRVLHLPGDEMKGRIIGREGRNIRAFESVTGVNLIIDDTPEAVLLSCFDPVRREIAPADPGTAGAGRPHPPAAHRGGLRAQQGRGRAAVRAVGARTPWSSWASPACTSELVPLLGRLRYRT